MATTLYICGPTGPGKQCTPVSYFDSCELAELAAKHKKLPPTHMHIGPKPGPAWGSAADCRAV